MSTVPASTLPSLPFPSGKVVYKTVEKHVAGTTQFRGVTRLPQAVQNYGRTHLPTPAHANGGAQEPLLAVASRQQSLPHHELPKKCLAFWASRREAFRVAIHLRVRSNQRKLPTHVYRNARACMRNDDSRIARYSPKHSKRDFLT